MAQANVARRQGDDFQGRLFWLSAASLLDPNSPVIKVSYETGPKSFDDLQIEYDPSKAPLDHQGYPIRRKHSQCKWHTTAGVFGYADLVDPNFINATSLSLLQRAHAAQQQHAPDGVGSQFEFVTNWRISADDPLLKLIRKSTGAIDLARLFDGTTDASKMGQLRKAWCQNLGIDHSGLNLVARTLSIAETTDSLDRLRELLDYRFAAVGLKRVPASESSFLYDDLIVKLLGQGRIEFDRDGFAEMARKEGIFVGTGGAERIFTIGVRSFIHPIDNLYDRCPVVLDLVPHFDGRYVRNPDDWKNRIYPELNGFVLKAARSTERLRVILDAHVSVAFAAGTMLNVKSGKHIEIEQRTGARRLWSMDDLPFNAEWPALRIEDEILDEHRKEVAIAIGLTHDVSPAAGKFVRQALPQVGKIIHCRPANGASQQSIACGRHAWMLAETVVKHIQSVRSHSGRISLLHIFIAGPNGFAFFLGQQQVALGPCALYEWDFEGERAGGYSQSLTIGTVAK